MTKKVDIWMPFLIDKYLGDTTHLNTEQHGAYVLLLLSMWKRGGSLPAIDSQLLSITRLQPAKWRQYREVLMAFFKEKDGQITQKRLVMELVNANKRSEAKSEAGAKGAAKRWEKDGESGGEKDGTANGTAMADGKQTGSQTGASISIPKTSSLRSDSEANASVAPRTALAPKAERGKRLPEDWVLPSGWGEWALAEYPHWDKEIVRKIGRDFADHFISEPGRKGVKLNWARTWSKWCNGEITQRQYPPPKTAGSATETNFARSRRERVSSLTGGLAAAKAPGALNQTKEIFDAEAPPLIGQ